MADPFAPRIFRVVAATDESELGERAVATALDQARGQSPAELHVVRVIDDMSGAWPGLLEDAREAAAQRARQELQERVARLVASRALSRTEPTQVVVHLRVGDPAAQIARLALDVDADLVVIGSHGRRGISRMIVGSVAEKTIRLAPCAVMVVKPTQPGAEEAMPEPPCPACTARRFETRGEHWWCDEHDKHRERPHVYSHSKVLSLRESMRFD